MALASPTRPCSFHTKDVKITAVSHSLDDTTRPLQALTSVLIDALRALQAGGQATTASHLAGRAYVTLRLQERGEAQRINALMHQLTRNLDPIKEQTMPATDPQLDVRSEIPARRHELIFETYDALAPGTGFELVNDHDPKPLYYQLAAEHPDQFTWDYLEEGPAVWRVRIGRPE